MFDLEFVVHLPSHAKLRSTIRVGPAWAFLDEVVQLVEFVEVALDGEGPASVW